ncbi:DNA primase [Mucilaginibacter rubeus]|uniref:DNA primase n=2 Tax=Mucilaginibacter rubeus TaxID=2027860 RepID=UPI0016681A00|nr:DNA primase [Mucilaginibacter rubeus]GGB26388.1 DNA primase [Mucilaginibacter rubeus]
MIQKSTIDRIMEATDIVEVIGEFVQLKKRGANYVGLSPFANERTPSFTVSPAKGIFKDFSTGKGGSAVTFLMELEKFSYPEALKWLAKKYGIEVEETVEAPENREEELRRESLLIVSAFAAKFFHETLLETEEGRSIGLSYFKERGFSTEIIKKFELGYSPDQWEAFTETAINMGYQPQFLEESGLSVRRENGSMYDRYRGRVMFPIHSSTGRIIAFGGRTLKKDKNVPKYVNSPESEIYHKSDVLYGFYFAKKSIREQDNCYLVEGYADVLSVFQAGIENVVASSGTSLTTEQIKLIGRQTKNITILYDGDSAGIKAAIRGLSLLYKERFNVKIVSFPDGHDPDSYVRNQGSAGFKYYIENKAKSLVEFYLTTVDKGDLIDPVKKIKVADDLAEILSNNLEPEFRKDYIKQVAENLKIGEAGFLNAVNKLVLAKHNKAFEQNRPVLPNPDFESDNSDIEEHRDEIISTDLLYSDQSQEKEIVRLLLHYGSRMIDWDGIANTYIGPFIIAELSDVTFDHPVCKQITEIYRREVENGVLPDEAYFIHHKDKAIVDLTINMLASKYSLSENWYEMHRITVYDEQVNMKATILGAIFHLKKHKVGKMLEDLRTQLQKADTEADQEILLNQYMRMKKVEKSISDFLGSVIIK